MDLDDRQGLIARSAMQQKKQPNKDPIHLRGETYLTRISSSSPAHSILIGVIIASTDTVNPRTHGVPSLYSSRFINLHPWIPPPTGVESAAGRRSQFGRSKTSSSRTIAKTANLQTETGLKLYKSWRVLIVRVLKEADHDLEPSAQLRSHKLVLYKL